MKRSKTNGSGLTRLSTARWRIVVMGAVVVVLLTGACTSSSNSSSGPASSGSPGTIAQPTQADLDAAGFGKLPLAPDSDRVDIAKPTFSNPTKITNPLFPISDLQSVVFSGQVEGKPFHTETTLLPQTRIIGWGDGEQVETRVSQYFAYLGGRIEEVALDYYAQADDGSVWYFGEDVSDFNEEGFIDSTEGTWLSGIDGPPAMIMPGKPKVGDVHRAENVPPIAFEEVKITGVNKTKDGPTGPVHGALIGRELHLDGTFSDKVFAPGYGEFYSADGNDVEALALAVPTDALDGGVPAELKSMSAGADKVFDAVIAGDWGAAKAALGPITAAWDDYRAGQVPPRLAPEMEHALQSLASAINGRNQANAGTAAIDVAQSTTDLQLRYRSPADIDRARFELWARQIIVDAMSDNVGGMRGDVTTMEFIHDRFVRTLNQPDVIRIDVHLMELRNTVNDDDPTAAREEAQALRETLAGITPAGDSAQGSTGGSASSPAGGSISSPAEGSASSPADTAPVIDPGDNGHYQPTIDPANFVNTVDNPYFPLRPGARWVYEGVADGGHARIELAVTSKHKQIMGISAVGVSDNNFLDGELAAQTVDWYSQDRDGNVWYLGEDTKEYENGVLKGTEGSWQAGVDGALPGVFMPAQPAAGDVYRQTFQPAKAEDLAQVERVGVDHSIDLGDYHDVIVTREWTPLEPDVIENKYYAPNVGKIYETNVAGGEGGTQLIQYTPGH
jgi:hypothetical protein